MAVTWPSALFPAAQSWRKSGASASGGRTMTGTEQVVRSDAGFWRCNMTLEVRAVGGRGEDQALAYRALMAQLDGMAGEVDVPCTEYWRPRDMNGRMLRANDGIFTGGRTLFNHVNWQKEPDRLMFVHGDTIAGSTRMAIKHPHVQGLRAGHYFGIGHRLYIVARAWQISYEEAALTGPEVYDAFDPVLDDAEQVVDGSLTGTRVGENIEVIDFWPRLRDDAASTTPLILGRPYCRMRLATDETGAFDAVVSQIGRPTLEFAEAI